MLTHVPVQQYTRHDALFFYLCFNHLVLYCLIYILIFFINLPSINRQKSCTSSVCIFHIDVPVNILLWLISPKGSLEGRRCTKGTFPVHKATDSLSSQYIHTKYDKEANTETRQDAWLHEKVLSHTKIILFSAAISRLFPLHQKIFPHSKKWKWHKQLRTFFYFVAFKIKIGVRKCFKSGWQSSRQKTGRGSRRTLKSRVRCSPTEKETGFRQETKKI